MLPRRRRGFPSHGFHMRKKHAFRSSSETFLGNRRSVAKRALTNGKVYFQITPQGDKAFLFLLNPRQRIATIRHAVFKKRERETNATAQQNRNFTLDVSSLMEYQIFVIDCHYAAFQPVSRRIRPLSEAVLQHAVTIKLTKFYSPSLGW
jgi:hypothetical protein